MDIEIPSIELDFPSFNLAADNIAEELPFQRCNDLPEVFVSDSFQAGTSIVEESVEDIEVADTPNVENLQEHGETLMEYNNDPDEQNENNENDKTYDLPPPVPSSFVESIHRPWPWDETIKLNPGILI